MQRLVCIPIQRTSTSLLTFCLYRTMSMMMMMMLVLVLVVVILIKVIALLERKQIVTEFWVMVRMGVAVIKVKAKGIVVREV